MTAPVHKIAVASRDGKLVYHFGQADRFLIFEISPLSVHYLETRSVSPACDPDFHEAGHERVIAETASSIADCRAVLVSRIGPGAAALLARRGIRPLQVSTFIKDALQEYLEGSCREAGECG